MYWLDYLQNGREAGELDWQAIGGTWGVATSRLGKWRRAADVRLPDQLLEVVGQIAGSGRSNGSILAAYVEKYGEDVAKHVASVGRVLRPGARAHYIVGNSVFYGVLVPIEKVYAALMRRAGFEKVEVRPIRKRNSKKELVEFCVSGTWSASGPRVGSPRRDRKPQPQELPAASRNRRHYRRRCRSCSELRSGCIRHLLWSVVEAQYRVEVVRLTKVAQSCTVGP